MRERKGGAGTEAGTRDSAGAPFDLHRTMENVVEAVAGQAHAKGLELIPFIHPGTPAGVRGDPGRLRQVLLGLIDNALRFTECGEVLVEVGLAEEWPRAAVLRFEISDTGIGIAPDAQARLFQSLPPVGWAAGRVAGRGPGLALSRRLVETMGGAIGVESSRGEGSTFWFTVRLGTWATALAVHSGAAVAGLRALVVDDSATASRVIRAHLGSWGVASEAAENGPQALRCLRTARAAGTPFDVAILDARMPDGSGVDLARAIRAEPTLAGPRLVLLTPPGGGGLGAAPREAGIAATLSKPVRSAQLRDALMTVPARPRSPLHRTAPPKNP